MMKSRGALGKGLGALLPNMGADGEEGGRQKSFFHCPLDEIRPNPYQPRRVMEEQALRDLAASIREKGIIQPIIVRKAPTEDGYELVAGERRWRAAKLAGLTQVPVLVKDVDPDDRLELALIENIQRQDLNPLEEADAYHRLITEYGLTQEQVAKRVGKERSTVANALRIIHLPDFAKEDVALGRLSGGHARVLLGMPDSEAMRELRDEIVSRQLSVRQAEALAQQWKAPQRGPEPGKKKAPPFFSTAQCKTFSARIAQCLGLKGRIVQNGGRGKLEIEYRSAEELERVIEIIGQSQGAAQRASGE